MDSDQIDVIWRPQVGPQKALVDCPLPVVFFGGARGGGKTDGVLGKWAIKEQVYGEDFNAIMFRRTTISAEDAIERSRQIYQPLGGRFNSSKLIWRMPHGGRVAFAYLDKISDADEYQGRNITDVWVEEAGQYPASGPIDRLFAVLRSAKGVPTQMILTANPGGAGQHWIRERFKLHPFPTSPTIVTVHNEIAGDYHAAVIPSRIADNRILLESDPTYLSRLKMVGSRELVKAWLEGDWSAIEGAFFDEFDEAKHILQPFSIPEEWTRFRSGDWGYASPFSIGWWGIVSDDYETQGKMIPRGALVRYREWYGMEEGKPNVGIRMNAEEVARGIKKKEQGEKIAYGVLDPATKASESGPSIMERMNILGGAWRPADNKRVGTRGAMGGWDQLRARLKGGGDGRPMIYFFATCRDTIRTLPVIQHDPDRPEDLDTNAEDHAPDEIRYACMSRPYVPVPREVKQKPKTIDDLTYQVDKDGRVRANMSVREIVEAKARRRKRR